MKKILMTVLLFVVTSDVFAIPTLTEASATGTTFKFATKLSEKLPTGYKVKIDLNNGKGLVAMTCSGLTCSLSSNALPKLDSPTYKIGVYNAKGVLQGAVLNGSYTISFLVNASGYSKISNSGDPLPDSAKLGSGANDWACTKDNRTGLIWEVKTTDFGLRDVGWGYSWYQRFDNGGDEGFKNGAYYNKKQHPEYCYGSECDTTAFTYSVNTKGLCGKNDWRMPTIDEIVKLIVCSDGKYEADGSCTNFGGIEEPAINTTYFPHMDGTYWSSSPDANNSSYARDVDFHSGIASINYKSQGLNLLLVR
jgi:hypothetical protein